MKPLGLFGGTFDPIHNGHLRLAVEVLEAFGLESLSLLPNKAPPHRAQPLADAGQRLAMARLAVEGVPGLKVDDIELRRAGHSYTVDTLEAFAGEHPGRPLLFVMGMDSLLSFTSWHRWQRILELASLAVCCRPGHLLDPLALDTRLASCLGEGPVTGPGAIRALTTTELAISATDIRARIAQGQRLDFLVPQAVAQYIEAQGLYRTPAAS
ncbi:nicotinate-nucleotide adenylyltransferase [Gallaecimonas kandeliae]|uniref:nicotinate-nucleotide adenylyltransferase n=1 Tax=Gallaecimonas kandeliae TaxID=3029055 RepID=UPI002648FB74|nr:nicotinate-nucleotide adenylyltransferase [Gallaecimonas kandeliae]WKE66630.1 nicotinate-nucleotide adenylyltransferase [Gallaecimonas kandeliae]